YHLSAALVSLVGIITPNSLNTEDDRMASALNFISHLPNMSRSPPHSGTSVALSFKSNLGSLRPAGVRSA
ncbi:MAG TPA: hypothetical protein VGO47_09980, partial [Chlamydiales bacterium]|nr:hypothetical protein [Chlamydiales bacterium]